MTKFNLNVNEDYVIFQLHHREDNKHKMRLFILGKFKMITIVLRLDLCQQLMMVCIFVQTLVGTHISYTSQAP